MGRQVAARDRTSRPNHTKRRADASPKTRTKRPRADLDRQAREGLTIDEAILVTRAASDIVKNRQDRLIGGAGSAQRPLRELYRLVLGTQSGKPIPPRERQARFEKAISRLGPYVERMASESDENRALAERDFWSEVDRHRRSFEILVQKERVERSALVGDEVLDADATVDETNWEEHRQILRPTLHQSVKTIKRLNKLVLLHRRDAIAKAYNALETGGTLPDGVPGGIVALRVLHDKLIALDALLKLEKGALIEQLRAADSITEGVASVGAIANTAFALLRASVSVSATTIAAIARVGGKTQIAKQALVFSGRFGSAIGQVVAAIEIVRGLAVLLDGDASAREKADAGVSMALGASTLANSVVGSALTTAISGVASGLFLLYMELTLLHDLYGAARTGLAGMVVHGLETLSELGGRVSGSAEKLAKAGMLHEREADSQKKKALEVVVTNAARDCASDIDMLLSACMPVSYSQGAARKPGYYRPIVARFAGLQKYRGQSSPRAVATAAKLVIEEVRWCLENAGDIVDDIAHARGQLIPPRMRKGARGETDQ